jgi:GGDEF domain-containing protein
MHPQEEKNTPSAVSPALQARSEAVVSVSETTFDPALLAEAPARYPGSGFYPSEFLEELEKSIQSVITGHTSGSLLLVSVSNLAMIINAYGHDTSEIVMHDLMRMIEGVIKPGSIVQRLQRDQLGIIAPNSYPEDAEALAQRIHNIIQNFGRDNFATAALYIIGTIGSVSFPLETTSAHDALDKAYVAVNSLHSAPHHTFEMTRLEADHCRQQMGLANYLYKAPGK